MISLKEKSNIKSGLPIPLPNILLVKRQLLFVLIISLFSFGMILMIASINFMYSGYRYNKRMSDGLKTVEIKHINGRYLLYRNGEPYFIKGASIYRTFNQIEEFGANSVRIYDTENAQEILDKAHELGLTVTLGLPMAYGKDMDYGNEAAVTAQMERLRKEVIKYKDHPALLMWGIGNEVDIKLRGSSFITKIRLWNAVNRLAKMVHNIDPNHPTTTMLADLKKKTILYISLFCNDIDILSINVFSQTKDFQKRLSAVGWNRPFIISEYGVLGHWDAPRTEWYAKVEPTSYTKAKLIRQQYASLVEANKSNCLGSYVFIWSSKQEYTSTWFSLLTEKGQQTEMTDALKYIWSGKWPSNRAPSIYSVTLNNKKSVDNIYLEGGKQFTATLKTRDPENENLCLNWEIQVEGSEIYFDPTRSQKKPNVIMQGKLNLESNSSGSKNAYRLMFDAPKEEGAYRVFFYVQDEQNKTATANVTFYVFN